MRISMRKNLFFINLFKILPHILQFEENPGSQRIGVPYIFHLHFFRSPGKLLQAIRPSFFLDEIDKKSKW